MVMERECQGGGGEKLVHSLENASRLASAVWQLEAFAAFAIVCICTGSKGKTFAANVLSCYVYFI